MEKSASPQVEGISHHRAKLNGADLHYVAAGERGSPILLVHGFPETWWTFRKLIPMLARTHRVFAVDLRGFGDSSNDPGEYGSSASAEDLHALIAELGLGPVHLTGQDISGASVYRLAVTHPEDVLSLTAIEMGLAGFGLEALADVTHGGAWHIGVLAAPGIAELLLAGRERDFLGRFAFPALCATPGAIGDADVDEFVRAFARPDGWRGAIGLYQSMLSEGRELRALADNPGLDRPVLAVGGGGGTFTVDTMSRAARTEVRSALFAGIGHYVAMEAPEKLSSVLLDFIDDIDIRPERPGATK
jgi:pimeloyl-ACP methyl ester carboxylesterase